MPAWICTCGAETDASLDHCAACGLPRPEEAAPPEEGCLNCHDLNVEPGYDTPLCAPCRTELANLGFPGWVALAGAVVMIALGLSLFRFTGSVNAAAAMRRGQQAEQAGQFAQAVLQYEAARRRFPDSTHLLARLTISKIKAKDGDGLDELVDQIAERELSESDYRDLDALLEPLREDSPPDGEAP